MRELKVNLAFGDFLRTKNAALHHAYAYPTRENRSKARALQRRLRARMLEVRNEGWSNLMQDITTSHQAFWKLTKALKSDGYLPTPLLKKIDSSFVVDDSEKAECLANSLELQSSYTIPPNGSHHITRIEEEKLVKNLNTKKAPGLDGISNKAIKCFPLTLLSLLVAIFNACLKNCYFPPVWKEAEVIGIHKPGKPLDLPASYRPINRHFMFRHENTHSTRRPIRAGVPQGFTLSPLLYSSYTNDIPRSSASVQLSSFADDTALYLRGATKRNICPHLQRAIDELDRWFQTWRIWANSEKSAAISFIYRKGRSSVVVARGTPSLRIYKHLFRVPSCAEIIPLRDPPHGKLCAVNTLACCPAVQELARGLEAERAAEAAIGRRRDVAGPP
ncbi:Probable RNA-directed DNA polymerase from transposon BS [Eumeta japonica]|uniref:Probable RNA-directed DNA polymerase from transposon BS n=1 Tax=Eumeta variegata TaxID=151549 RepID=A0A4C1UL52_EUMVA|nr:Probable RNA-directed DNA polymerase from transposon BS [Eumeta japonica]